MLKNRQTARDDDILQLASVGNVNLLALLTYYNDGALERDILAQGDVARDGQMVELHNLGDVGNALLEIANLLVMAAQLYERRAAKSQRAQLQLAAVHRVQVRLDQQQIGRGLDGQEAASGHIDTVRIAKVSDCGADGSLQLDDIKVHTRLGGEGLDVGDNLHAQFIVLNHALDGLEVDPQVVGVEVLELLDGLELLGALLGHLRNLQESHRAVVVNNGTTLDIGLGLVGKLHNVLALRLDHVLQNVKVNHSAQIVNVGDKQNLLALGEKLIQNARVGNGLKQVTVARGVPGIDAVLVVLGDGQKRVLVDAGEARLVERLDADIVGLVLLDDGLCVVIRVERVHENEGDIDIVLAIEVLNLANTQIQKGLAVADLNDGLGADAAHGGSETTIELEDGELGEIVGVGLVALDVAVGDNLLGVRGVDALPLEGGALGLVSQISSEQGKEVVHFVLKLALLAVVLDSVGEAIEGIAHLAGGHGRSIVVKSLEG